MWISVPRAARPAGSTRPAWTARAVEAGMSGITRSAGSAWTARAARAVEAGMSGITRSAGSAWTARAARAVEAGMSRTTRSAGTSRSTGTPRSAGAPGSTGAARVIRPGGGVDATGRRRPMATAGSRRGSAGSGVSQAGAHAQCRRAEGTREAARRDESFQFHGSPHLLVDHRKLTPV
ncbi:hypothetical protein X011_07220 [Mycobacterium tuberculosis variant microti OV254]|nr:hypothetical protein X011_07220 [Mycobacterium tuberculosis variant microti OV254]